MLAFMVLALGISFTAGSVGTSASCDPADCASACEIVSSAECVALCPPECIVLCEEVCADAKQASVECMPGCSISDCLMGTKASGTLAGIDPAGTLSFKLAAGQGAEINK
jgi:hypothetical protein